MKSNIYKIILGKIEQGAAQVCLPPLGISWRSIFIVPKPPLIFSIFTSTMGIKGVWQIITGYEI